MTRLFHSLLLSLLLSITHTSVAETSPMTKIGDGVYHFWQGDYSSLIVVGDNGVLLMDPAFTPRAQAMQAEIKKITDKPIKYVALSHEHFDHVGGFEVFTGAQIICQADCADIFALSPFMPAPKVDITFETRYEVDLGGKVVELYHPAVGDGVGATIARVKGTGIAFATDMYRHRGFVPGYFIEHSNFVGVRKILHALQAWKPTYVINGHSPGNSLADLNENTVFYDKLYDKVLSAFQQAMAKGGPEQVINTMFTLPDTLKMDEYKDWENYEENFPAHVKRMALSIVHGG